MNKDSYCGIPVSNFATFATQEAFFRLILWCGWEEEELWLQINGLSSAEAKLNGEGGKDAILARQTRSHNDRSNLFLDVLRISPV